MATILEALENAKYNLTNSIPNVMQSMIGKEQLSNSIILLKKGYDPYDDIEELIEEHGSIESVPEKE